jgi:protein TonB
MTSIADSPIPAPRSGGAGSDARAMLLALTLAAVAHALVLFGIGFELPVARVPDLTIIDVMLIKHSTADQPAPDAVAAQADRAAETSTPLPELEAPEPDFLPDSEIDSADAPPEPLPEPASAAIAESLPEPLPMPMPEPMPEPVPDPPSAPALEPEPLSRVPDILDAPETPLPLELPQAVSAADILASRNAEIAQLTARINAQTSAYASRARRKAISTSTREYRYASYMEAWRRKVERIGNLNYPEEAARRGLYGALILHVAVRADGSLEGIRVLRSSGQEVLDQAAMRIVELAAPFAPFPADIAAETDVLDITRTWQFQRNNRLGWDK